MATRYRDLERTTLIDVGARSTPTGGASAASQLADTFASFSRASSDVGAQLSAEIGRKRGTSDGLSGTFKKRSGLTAYGQSYNSAAEAGYSAKTQVDIDETVARLEDEHEADPEGFEQKVSAYAEGLVSEAPEELRERVALIVRARATAGANRVRGQAMAKDRAQAHADFIGSMSARVSNTIAMLETMDAADGDVALTESVADNKAQLAALVKDNVIDPLTAAKYDAQYAEAIDEGLNELRISGTLEALSNAMRSDVQAGDAMLAGIQARTDISIDDRNEIGKRYRAEREALSFERSRTSVAESGELARTIAAGGHGAEAEAENLRLYKHGAISVDEYESNISSMTRNAKEGAEDGLDIEAVTLAMNGGRGLDPAIPKQREAADKWFRAITAANGMEMGDDRWQALAASMAVRTNVLPASAQSWARVNMMTGDPKEVALGASFFGRIKEANPQAWDYSDDPRIAAFAEQINGSLASGVVTERAFEMARKNVYELDDNARRLLSERYRVDKVGDGNIDVLQSDLNGDSNFDRTFFGGAPEAPLAMQAEYDQLVHEFYSYTGGDVEMSRQLASEAVRSVYGYTQVNGTPEIVKFAPEKMYPGLTPEIVRSDVAATLTEIGVEADPAAVRLTPLPATERTRGRVWLLQQPDEYGAYDTVRDKDNVPVLYELPLGNNYDAARRTLAQQKVDEAAAERERQQKREARERELAEQFFLTPQQGLGFK